MDEPQGCHFSVCVLSESIPRQPERIKNIIGLAKQERIAAPDRGYGKKSRLIMALITAP